MSIVYLAGGINGLSDADAADWRAEATERLAAHGIEVLDPMARDYRGQEDANVDAIVEGDLADIDTSDAVIAYCPRPSWGTAMEIHYVATSGMWRPNATAVANPMRNLVAVVPAGQPVSPWLRYHADAVVETLAEAVAVVTEWLA